MKVKKGRGGAAAFYEVFVCVVFLQSDEGFLFCRDLDAALPTAKPKIMTSFHDPQKVSVHSGLLRYAERGVGIRQWCQNKASSRSNQSKTKKKANKQTLADRDKGR